MFAVWTTSFAFGKSLLAEASPVQLTALRMLLAGTLIGGFLLLKKRGDLKLGKKQILSLGVLGFFSIYLTNICEYWGLSHLTSAKTCFIYSLSPFFAAILSYVHFREKVTPRKLLGLLIGFLGMIPVFRMQSGSENLLQAFGIFSWPDLAVVAAALFSVYGWVLLRLAVKDQEISPWTANGVSMLFGGLLALVHSSFIDTWPPAVFSSSKLMPFIGTLLLLTLISNIICFNLYGYLLKRFTATFLSFAGLLSPIFASLFGWWWLGETPSWTILFSTILVGFGLWIVYTTELKQGYLVRKSARNISI